MLEDATNRSKLTPSLMKDEGLLADGDEKVES
jgi:hypothetical protein